MDATIAGVLVNIIIAAGTCGAVAVAFLTNKRTSFENTFNLLLSQHNTALLNLKKEEKYNKIVVPKGGEFHLVLADGSEQ